MIAPRETDAGRPEDDRGGGRELLAGPAAAQAARRRAMSEHLELALSWNSVAAELRAGIAAERGAASKPR
jgi:hypothetical protein